MKDLIFSLKSYKAAYSSWLFKEHYSISGKSKKVFFSLVFLWKYRNKVITPLNISSDNQVNTLYQYRKVFVQAKPRILEGYLYPLDISYIFMPGKGFKLIDSTTPDYADILELVSQNVKGEIQQKVFSILQDKIHKDLQYLKTKLSFPRVRFFLDYLPEMFKRKPLTLDEAIQKIVYVNGIIWQCGTKLNGLGRLDEILYPYYKKDLEDGILDRERAKDLIVKMIRVLGRDTYYKSASLIGDTGQVILLGGSTKNERCVENDLTELFLEIFTEHPLPDPKLILRVNKYTSDKIWRMAIQTILSGSGSPLIMNEEQIMPAMERFGYSKEDCFNFGTSACWEPLVIGKSLDQNNSKSFIALDILHELIYTRSFTRFNDLVIAYKKTLAEYISSYTISINPSPIHSLFFDDGYKCGKDFVENATYCFHGFLVVSFPNLINSLLNLKKYIFEDRLFSWEELRVALNTDYMGYEDMRQLFLNNPLKFGSAEKEVLELTNDLMRSISERTEQITINGKKAKVGFSSPVYIQCSHHYPASPDGRKKGAPFAVHISPVSKNIDIAEILDFASSLDYSGNRINGNVVDFILPSAYIKYPDKLLAILRNGFDKGVYELQLNVLDKETLIDAKKHPEKYPHLIVRVWGFSAYFNELPEEYKDNLIERAENYAC